jgi:hypothetical protein
MLRNPVSRCPLFISRSHADNLLKIRHVLLQLIAEFRADDIIGLTLELFIFCRYAFHRNPFTQIHSENLLPFLGQ